MSASLPFPELFANSVLRMAKHRGRPLVVKLGGSAMEDPTATRGCLQSVAALNQLGVPIVLVHGGGKPIDRAMADAGLTPKKVAGRRYTDSATLGIVVRVLKDEINPGLVQTLNELGTHAKACPEALLGERLTLPGTDGQSIDLGFVGSITEVSVSKLRHSLTRHTIPVVPSIALDTSGGWLNVNADTVASAVAGALGVGRAVFLTDTPGVLRDRNDPASLIPKLTEAECRNLITTGVIDGGMVPKVEACFEALAAGAQSALILDGRVPHVLLDLFLSDAFRGTEITRD
jgi:acetylglutamate kinase